MPATTAEPSAESVRRALTFHASFDGQADADVARGDRRLYTASSFQRTDVKAGLHRADVEIAKGQGKYGDALRFRTNDKAIIFFQAEQNIAYRPKDWSGTIAFWLSLDPDKDLKPGYCDPIQITDKKWDDSAFFVDFTKDDTPRHFRLGIYSDYKVWNPEGIKFDLLPAAAKPLSDEVARPPFARNKWTHVLFTFSGLNTGMAAGTGVLYLDGKPAARIRNRKLTLTWEPSRAVIMLGLSYIGLYDDLAIFDRALTAEEVELVYRLDGGVRSLGK
jgi:hypothetical protein